MKYLHRHRTTSLLFHFALLFCGIQFHPVAAQVSGKNINAECLLETVRISTDREIYIAGEEVYFKVSKTNALTGIPDSMSKVVYIELLDKNYFPVRQARIRTAGSSGSSSFVIPPKSGSGRYLMRAYTRWMENWPSACYGMKEISVLNPFDDVGSLVRSTSEENIREPAVVNSGLFTDAPVIKISADKNIYTRREKVRLVVDLKDSKDRPVDADLSISVVRSVLSDSVNYSTFFSPPRAGGISYHCLPELEGHLISGTLKAKNSGQPIVNAGVSLSFVGKKARCQFVKTSSDGHFYFVVNNPGTEEIVIQPVSREESGWYIDVDQSFSDSTGKWKSAGFYPDSASIEGLNKSVISMQIRNIYLPFINNRVKTEQAKTDDFYGKPDASVRIDDYIELTTVREAVKEIIPGVLVTKQDGKSAFRIINKLRAVNFENNPLILVDGIPVYDVDEVLNMNSREIERVDVINTRYHYSEFVFDGVISFITKKGNLSSVELENSVFRQVYDFFSVPAAFHFPDYSTDSSAKSRIPDFRNTLFWDPGQYASAGKAAVEFYTSDEPGEFTVIVEGVTRDGQPVHSTAHIIVK